MKKNIEINKEEGTVTVEVTVSKRSYVKDPIISFKTKDIALLLEKEGISVDVCVQNDTVYNDGRVPKTKGVWVFKLRAQKKNSAPVPKPQIPTRNDDTKKTSSLTNVQEPAKIKSKTKTSKKRK